MNSKTIANQFARMGARFRIVRPETYAWNRRPADYALNIVFDKWGQLFEMRLRTEREAQFAMNVLQRDRHDRHLLLLVKIHNHHDVSDWQHFLR